MDGKRLAELGDQRDHGRSKDQSPRLKRPRQPTRDAWAATAMVEEVEAVRGAPDGTRNEQLNKSAYALGQLIGSGLLEETAVRRELLLAAKVAGLGEAEARATVTSGVTAGRREPRRPSRASNRTNRRKVARTEKSHNETDLGNAERFVAQHGHAVRYCPERKRWLTFDGGRYVWDNDGAILRRCKKTVRSIYGEASKLGGDARKQRFKHAVRSERRERLAAMADLAKSEEGVPVRVDELDANPYLLNARNGTIDLRDGALRPHSQEDLITKSVAADFDLEATDPLWQGFLETITGGDDSLACYLQRICGYALIGTSTEKAFFCFHGDADTGKSTLLNGVSHALGDYAATADSDTWLRRSQVGGNRGDVVRLRGRRFVTSSEFRENARFDEALIKRVTGGDEITAAAKYEGEVSFRATFTLIIAANDPPLIRDDDRALWRRYYPVPFRHVPEHPDPTLSEKLRAPEVVRAILGWAVRGCMQWQELGLQPPAAAVSSAEAHRLEMDRFASFAGQHLIFGEGGSLSRFEVRSRYQAWCDVEGIHALSPKKLAARLRRCGATDGKSSGATVWKNVRWAAPSEGHEG